LRGPLGLNLGLELSHHFLVMALGSLELLAVFFQKSLLFWLFFSAIVITTFDESDQMIQESSQIEQHLEK
jgi:hypothetical protein